jgi:hypothetical protein
VNLGYLELLRELSAAEARFLVGREELIRNRRAVGRPRDLADIADLEESSGQ